MPEGRREEECFKGWERLEWAEGRGGGGGNGLEMDCGRKEIGQDECEGKR